VRPGAEPVIRAAYAAFNEGRFADWATANLPADFQLVPQAGSVVPRDRFTGLEQTLEFFEDLAQIWDRAALEIEEIVDNGDRVVMLGRARNRGRGSGLEVDVVAAHVWTFEAGVPRRIELIGDREEALRRGREPT